VHKEENRKRRLATLGRADALAPQVERNVALLDPIFRGPDRTFSRLRPPAPLVCACAVRADTSPAPTPRLAPLRMVRRASAGGSGLFVMASSDVGTSAPFASASRALGALKAVVGRILSDRCGGRQIGCPRANTRTCRNTRPRPPQRVLLLVADHRLEPSEDGVARREWKSDIATTIWWGCAGSRNIA
jgi:hypothetical protein